MVFSQLQYTTSYVCLCDCDTHKAHKYYIYVIATQQKFKYILQPDNKETGT